MSIVHGICYGSLILSLSLSLMLPLCLLECIHTAYTHIHTVLLLDIGKLGHKKIYTYYIHMYIMHISLYIPA